MLALAALLAIATGVGPAPSREPSVTWQPRRVTLGEVATVKLKIHSPGALPPVVACTVGTVSAPKEAGMDEWSAILTLPAGGTPRLAIVSVAREDPEGPVFAFAAIPLRGRATVPAQTEPGAKVLVTVGGEEFGPVTADDQGAAQAQVSVPPGVRIAKVRATGPGGTTTEREVDLAVPAVSRLAIAALPAGPGRAAVEVFYSGKPPAEPVLGPEKGTPGPLEPKGPGRWRTTLTAPLERIHVKVAIPGDITSEADTFVDLSPPRVTTVEGSLDPPKLEPGQKAKLTVTVRDAAGRPIEARLEASVGDTGLSMTAEGPGRYVAEIAPDGGGQLPVEVRAEGGGGEAVWKATLDTGGPARPREQPYAALAYAQGEAGVRFPFGGAVGLEAGLGYGRSFHRTPAFALGWRAELHARGTSRSVDYVNRRPAVSAFEFGVDAAFTLRAAAGRGFLTTGLGAGAAYASANVLGFGRNYNPDGLLPDVLVFLGYGHPAGGGVFFGELSYRQPIGARSFADAASELGGLGIVVGYQFHQL